ncbi:MAG: MATE family efflux transporter [Victivallales bacterium]|nr:MATE family efflux transporter [Victivallales bacterium]
MLHGPIFRGLTWFALPLIATNLLQLLFNTADVMVIGRFGTGANALAAVGVSSATAATYVNFIINFAAGATVVAGTALGAQNSVRLRQTIHAAMGFALMGGFVMMALMAVTMKPLLTLLQTPPEVFDEALRYLWFYLPSVPACALYNFGAALLRAKGDTQRPFCILTASGIVNVLLNLFFVLVLKMNVAGVALATTISFYLSAAALIYLLCHEKDDFHLDLRSLTIHSSTLPALINIGLTNALQGSLFHASNLVVQGAINSFGAAAIAGNTASANIGGYLWTCMQGFALASMSFAAQNTGAKNYPRVWQVCWRAMFAAFAIGLFLGLICVAFGRDLLGLYTTDTEAIQAGLHRLHFICGFYAICGVMDTAAYTIRGMGYPVLPTIVSIAGVLGIRLAWIFTLFRLPRFHSLFWLYMTYPVSWTITLAVHMIVLAFLLRRKIRQQPLPSGKNVTGLP